MPTVTFLDNGERYEIPEGSYLEACQELDIPHDFGCTVGSCGTCRCEIVEGAENVQPPSDEEKETLDMVTDHAGARLGCMLTVTGDVTIRSVD